MKEMLKMMTDEDFQWTLQTFCGMIPNAIEANEVPKVSKAYADILLEQGNKWAGIFSLAAILAMARNGFADKDQLVKMAVDLNLEIF